MSSAFYPDFLTLAKKFPTDELPPNTQILQTCKQVAESQADFPPEVIKKSHESGYFQLYRVGLALARWSRTMHQTVADTATPAAAKKACEIYDDLNRSLTNIDEPWNIPPEAKLPFGEVPQKGAFQNQVQKQLPRLGILGLLQELSPQEITIVDSIYTDTRQSRVDAYGLELGRVVEEQKTSVTTVQEEIAQTAKGHGCEAVQEQMFEMDWPDVSEQVRQLLDLVKIAKGKNILGEPRVGKGLKPYADLIEEMIRRNHKRNLEANLIQSWEASNAILSMSGIFDTARTLFRRHLVDGLTIDLGKKAVILGGSGVGQGAEAPTAALPREQIDNQYSQKVIDDVQLEIAALQAQGMRGKELFKGVAKRVHQDRTGNPELFKYLSALNDSGHLE